VAGSTERKKSKRRKKRKKRKKRIEFRDPKKAVRRAETNLGRRPVTGLTAPPEGLFGP
jgi:hypothetical protein